MVCESISKTTYLFIPQNATEDRTLREDFYVLHNVEDLGKVLERKRTGDIFLEGTPQMNLFLERLKDNK